MIKTKHMVTFTAEGGYDREQEEAKKILVIGQQYELVKAQMFGWSSNFELKGFEGKTFNTCLFSYNDETREYLESTFVNNYV